MSQPELFDLSASLPQTPKKAKNPMFRSHYLTNSVKVETTPDVLKTFFYNKPVKLQSFSLKDFTAIYLR